MASGSGATLVGTGRRGGCQAEAGKETFARHKIHALQSGNVHGSVGLGASVLREWQIDVKRVEEGEAAGY